MRDFDIRNALRADLKRTHSSDPSTLIVEELGLFQGQSRADLVVINGFLIGYEIKSQYDTLERLPRQREAYEKVFDFVTLVVVEKHLEAAKKEVPESWGILLAEARQGAVSLGEIRRASPNKNVDSDAIVQLLWKEEVLAVLTALGIGRRLKTTTRRELWAFLALSLSPEDLRQAVRERIKARGDWRAEKRQARGNDSSPTDATAEDPLAGLNWLTSLESRDRLD